jgi:hypothetical protein
MMGEIFKIYKKNFKNFVIFFILSVILALILTKLGGAFTESSNLEPSGFINIFNGKPITKIFAFVLIDIYINTYGLVIARKAIKEDLIDEGKVFSDALHFYPRILGISIAYIIIIWLIGLLFYSMMISAKSSYGLVILLAFLLLIALAVIGIFANPITNYLIYHDEAIKLSIKEGIKIGKKYFFKILGLLVIAALLSTLTTTNVSKNNILALIIANFIVSMYTMYLNLYIINLCKIEGQIN